MAHLWLWLVNHTRGMKSTIGRLCFCIPEFTKQRSYSGAATRLFGCLSRLYTENHNHSNPWLKTLETWSTVSGFLTGTGAAMNPPKWVWRIHKWPFATKSRQLPRSIPVTGFLIFPIPFCAENEAFLLIVNVLQVYADHDVTA